MRRTLPEIRDWAPQSCLFWRYEPKISPSLQNQSPIARKSAQPKPLIRCSLNRVDQLSKKIAGVRFAYDMFCEFLHPNSGDLFSATMRSTAHVDSWGTRHLTRKIGIGGRDFSSEPQLSAVLGSSLDIAISVLNLGLVLHESLDRDADALLKVNKKIMHSVRKKQKHIFRARDLCPCLSGKEVSLCK